MAGTVAGLLRGQSAEAVYRKQVLPTSPEHPEPEGRGPGGRVWLTEEGTGRGGWAQGQDVSVAGSAPQEPSRWKITTA